VAEPVVAEQGIADLVVLVPMHKLVQELLARMVQVTQVTVAPVAPEAVDYLAVMVDLVQMETQAEQADIQAAADLVLAVQHQEAQT
jgi:hypothetical protein